MIEFKSYLKRLHLLSQMEIHLMDEGGIEIFHLHNKEAGYIYREKVNYTLGILRNYILENMNLINRENEIFHLNIEELSYIITFVFLEGQHFVLALGPFICEEREEISRVYEGREFRKISKLDIEKVAYFLESKNWKTEERKAVNSINISGNNLIKNSKEDLIATNYEYISYNDKFENYILGLVESGNYTKLKDYILNHDYDIPEHYDLDDDKRTMKNFVLTMNSLCCRAAIKGGISSVYARSFCATIATKVEKIKDINALKELRIEIILSYCKKVQDYKLEGYGELLKKSIHYINDNISEEITLASLAKHCNVSYEYLSRYIKKESGYTFSSLIQKIRVENAKHLLKVDYSITEITSMVGLKSTSQFCRVFKKYAGVTAREWKANNK